MPAIHLHNKSWDSGMFTIVTILELKIMIVAVSQKDLCPFLLNTTFQLVCGCCRLTLPFVMLHTLSLGDRSGLQAGQSSTHSASMKSWRLKVVQNEIWHCNNHRHPRKIMLSWRHYISLQNSTWVCINGAFTHMQDVINIMCTDPPQNHHRCCLLHFFLITAWIVVLIFGM